MLLGDLTCEFWAEIGKTFFGCRAHKQEMAQGE